MQRVARSQFLEKLHDLLARRLDEENFRWISNDSFQITSDETKARRALSPSWDFQSLSSFCRQLSYYQFRRLSDRRRSGERNSDEPAFVIFCHPGGNFLRDDSSRLHLIVRKVRIRTRVGSTSSRRSTASSSSTAPTLSPLQSPDLSQLPSFPEHPDSPQSRERQPNPHCYIASPPTPIQQQYQSPSQNSYPENSRGSLWGEAREREEFSERSVDENFIGGGLVSPQILSDRHCFPSTTTTEENPPDQLYQRQRQSIPEVEAQSRFEDAAGPIPSEERTPYQHHQPTGLVTNYVYDDGGRDRFYSAPSSYLPPPPSTTTSSHSGSPNISYERSPRTYYTNHPDRLPSPLPPISRFDSYTPASLPSPLPLPNEQYYYPPNIRPPSHWNEGSHPRAGLQYPQEDNRRWDGQE